MLFIKIDYRILLLFGLYWIMASCQKAKDKPSPAPTDPLLPWIENGF
jgi:hypothetical protein